MAGWMGGGRQEGWRVGWPGWVARWLTGRLAGEMAGWRACWLTGWLARFYTFFLFGVSRWGHNKKNYGLVCGLEGKIGFLVGNREFPSILNLFDSREIRFF